MRSVLKTTLLLAFIASIADIAAVRTYNDGRCKDEVVNGKRKSYFRTRLGYRLCTSTSCPDSKDGPFKECHVCCYTNIVKAVNGSWTEWTESDCLGKCGEGIQVFSRSCTSPTPSGNGKMCRLEDGSLGIVEIKHERCHLKKCTVNGSWTEWTDTDCLGKCGEGVKVFSRSCTSPSPSGNGKMCRLDDGSLGVMEIKHERCNLKKCTVDVNAGLIYMDKWLAYTPSLFAFIVGILLTILAINRKPIMKFIREKVSVLRQQKPLEAVAYKCDVDDHTTLLKPKIIDDDLEKRNKPDPDEMHVEYTDSVAEQIADSNDIQALNDTQIESTIQSQTCVVMPTISLNQPEI